MTWEELQIGKYYWVRYPQTEWVYINPSLHYGQHVPIKDKWHPEQLCFYEGMGLEVFGSEEAYWPSDKVDIVREANVS